ncbi:YjjG family noncanonical pyrimidine nucleotidase [Nafulsella turpanensis]|uniref:YjjG family noncanonical pyrimidine nucleotidase n=1 Tax=Nafulsella turpanensis TaxID=1265690 RepID=UPI000344A7D1|nr:YjjG family noncanonical pyrimidine nucleotidase [Nafulsella turpanensis]
MSLPAKKYKYILFDLDHTLWDFEQNSADTLSDLYEKYELARLGVSCENSFKETFKQVNGELWAQSDEGKMDRNLLRVRRFQLVCEALGVRNEVLAARLGEDYVTLCPTKKALLPYALDMLEFLRKKYPLFILTNGFDDVQAVKLNSAGILHFFEAVFTGEALGLKKPQKAYFSTFLQQIEARPEECLMIGDNLKTDILGAQNAGIDHIYYNPLGRDYFMHVQHEIRCLSELKNLL